ncbi:MAG: helix-turn-helix transcriptional regulator [Eubacteriales bacterium]|nr:helix-turn-helix transcriptional regulator [Eubacteriales bacterium]
MSALQQLRMSHGLSLEQLANRLNIEPVTLSEFENGILPSVAELMIIAEYFCVTTDFLLGLKFTFGQLTYDQQELISTYDSLDNFSKGLAIENIRILAEKKRQSDKSKSNKIITVADKVIFVNFS